MKDVEGPDGPTVLGLPVRRALAALRDGVSRIVRPSAVVIKACRESAPAVRRHHLFHNWCVPSSRPSRLFVLVLLAIIVVRSTPGQSSLRTTHIPWSRRRDP